VDNPQPCGCGFFRDFPEKGALPHFRFPKFLMAGFVSGFAVFADGENRENFV
jgi:hypothetical protein